MKTFLTTIFCILFAGTFLTSFDNNEQTVNIEKQEKKVDSMIVQVDRIQAQLKSIN